MLQVLIQKFKFMSNEFKLTNWSFRSILNSLVISSDLILSWRRPLSYRANQWSGFYKITVSVMKMLNPDLIFNLRI